MANTTGSVSVQINMSDSIPAGSSHITGYSVPCRPTDNTVTYATAGTAANQVLRHASASGTASATPATLDLTTAATSDGTTGLAHVRVLALYNDDGTNILTFGAGTNPFTPMLGGTTPTVIIQPGSCVIFQHPLGTNGWATGSGSKVVQLDPGSNNVAYRIVAIGD
jgi:hypothetical protein